MCIAGPTAAIHTCFKGCCFFLASKGYAERLCRANILFHIDDRREVRWRTAISPWCLISFNFTIITSFPQWLSFKSLPHAYAQQFPFFTKSLKVSSPRGSFQVEAYTLVCFFQRPASNFHLLKMSWRGGKKKDSHNYTVFPPILFLVPHSQLSLWHFHHEIPWLEKMY